MIYEIIIQRPAYKDLKGLPVKERDRINEKIALLAENPRPHNSEKLTDRSDEYRLKTGNYRVLYKIDDKNKKVFVARIKRRTDTTYR